MLEVEVPDGAAVGEVVEAEVEVEHLRRRRLLPLRQAAMSETRRWSLSHSCMNRRVSATNPRSICHDRFSNKTFIEKPTLLSDQYRKIFLTSRQILDTDIQ